MLFFLPLSGRANSSFLVTIILEFKKSYAGESSSYRELSHLAIQNYCPKGSIRWFVVNGQVIQRKTAVNYRPDSNILRIDINTLEVRIKTAEITVLAVIPRGLGVLITESNPQG
jgi:hypothetical protein